MYHFMGYNKDRDIYNELTAFDDMKMADAHIGTYQTMLCNDELKDEVGEPYDWVEVWNDEDDNGVDDLIITR